jgi:hypothetical protein
VFGGHGWRIDLTPQINLIAIDCGLDAEVEVVRLVLEDRERVTPWWQLVWLLVLEVLFNGVAEGVVRNHLHTIQCQSRNR